MSANENLYALFEDRFQAAAEGDAFRLPGRGEAISYGALHEQVCRYANALEGLGVQTGDRVMAQVEKSLEAVYLYLATVKCGAIFNPLNTAYTAAELEYFLSNAEPAVLVAGDDSRASLEPLAQAQGGCAFVSLNHDGSGELAMLAQEQAASHETVVRASDDVACLLYTSGTTGRSKGAMLMHGNLSSNALTLHAYWHFQPNDVLLHALPIFHVHGLFVALNTSFLNATPIIWLERFSVDEIIAHLPQSTVLMGVPTFYTRLLSSEAFTKEVCANMRLFVAGSAPLLAETHEAFEARTGHRILERYGMTEAGMITSNPYEGERIAGTVGYALPGVTCRVADDNGKELPKGEVGTLEISGPNVFKGYWQMPDKTAEEFRQDGFFITGDLATMGDDGRVTIVGRAKDLIISGGYNIYPKEIEQELNDIDGVGESAVVGVPHPDFGEGVVAFVTKDGTKPAPSEEEIIALLGDRLAKFKLPKRVFEVDTLPRNAMGKVQKAELRKEQEQIFM